MYAETYCGCSKEMIKECRISKELHQNKKESSEAMHINKELINKINEWKTGVSVSKKVYKKVLLLYVYSLAFTLSPTVPIYTAAHLKNFI